jgi:transcriptional regulator with XRE-family HTH domain
MKSDEYPPKRTEAAMKHGTNSWGQLLAVHRTRCGMNQDKLAKIMGITQSLVSCYERGKTLPPLDQVSDMCVTLDLTGTERQRFVEEAYLAHTPDRVLAIVMDLRVQVRRLRKLLTDRGIDLPDI